MAVVDHVEVMQRVLSKSERRLPRHTFCLFDDLGHARQVQIQPGPSVERVMYHAAEYHDCPAGVLIEEHGQYVESRWFSSDQQGKEWRGTRGVSGRVSNWEQVGDWTLQPPEGWALDFA